ncbi:MAG: hypothetical protein KC713_04795, partial [Candidatus Omnitrophica bacterium]|nr:hypothetical protein [Candidatus Omnitrophota bacterium]
MITEFKNNFENCFLYKYFRIFLICIFLLNQFSLNTYAELLQDKLKDSHSERIDVTFKIRTPSQAFQPSTLKGIKLSPNNALVFDFILDPGDDSSDQNNLKIIGEKLIKYFLAALTVPEDEMWVNLSPYEDDRIMSERFSQTDMGRDMLTQDYLLKQFMSSMMYPEEEIGRQFWERIYAQAYQQYGTL